MLETIPIYRMALCPETFLPEANLPKPIIDLVCDLPNSQNKYRKKGFANLPIEKHKAHYLAELLMESKIFTREMLSNVRENVSIYQGTLLQNDISAIFQIIEDHRLSFFRFLVLNDLRESKLLKGRMESDILNSLSVEEIKRSIKKYGVLWSLVNKLNSNYQQLKSIYC